MKKAFGILSLLLALIWIPYHSTLHQAVAAVRIDGTPSPTAQPTATLIFRGLMIFRPDPARRYFEVGILKAPEHEFRVQVRENSPNGVSTFSVPLEQLASAVGDVWSIEFGNSTNQAVSLYQNGPFERSSGAGDEKDFRWVIDLEGREFYGRRLPMNKDQPGLVLRMASGEFYANKKTRPLMRKKGDGTFQYFGSVADEVATDISLNQGEMVLKSQTGTEILRLKAKPDTTYEIIIENAFVGDHHLASSLNHFLYYYDLIAEPKPERYEFRVASANESSAANSGRANFMLTNYIPRISPKTDEIPCMPIGLGGGQ